MIKLLIDRAVVEQALAAFEQINSPYWSDFVSNHIAAFRAALEQPQVEQEPVTEVGVIGWKNHLPNSGTVVHWTALMPPLGTKLYTHQQPPRQPLTDEVRSLIASMVAELRAHRYCGDCYPENGWPEVNKVLADYAVFKRAHGIGGEK